MSGPNGDLVETLTTSDTHQSYNISSVLAAEPFLDTTLSNFFLLNPILRSSQPALNNADWWGFLNYSDGVTKVAALKVEWSTGSPIVKVVTSTSPSWNYSTVASGTLTSAPAAIVTETEVKTLHEENGQFQLWGSKQMSTYGSNIACDTNTSLQCTTPDTFPPETLGCRMGDRFILPLGDFGRAFWLNTGPKGDVTCPSCPGSGFVWWPVTSTSIGDSNLVYSEVRPLPSGYKEARMYPFRWNSPAGKRFLFSVTNDDNICTKFLYNPYYLLQVVKTRLEIALFRDGFESGDTSAWSLF